MPEEDKSTVTDDKSKTQPSDDKTTDTKKTDDTTKKTEGSEDKEKRYSETYVHTITQENARRRRHEEELEEALKTYKDKEIEAETDLKKKNDALDRRNKELEKTFNEKLSASDRRFILSEARRVAREAGMIDVDDIKTLDLADLRISDSDTVSGLEEKVAELKKSKPHWFKSVTDDKKDDKKEDDKTNKRDRKLGTPGRKGEAETTKDWGTSDAKEIRSHLAGYGVMV